jgi:hypothetical protein
VISLYAQIEMIPLEANFHATNIYDFLKEMRVKQVLRDIHDDNPNLSRAEVIQFLNEIESRWNDLSETEKKLTKRFQRTFQTPEADSEDYSFFFGSNESAPRHFRDIFSDKEKQTYFYRDGGDNLFVELYGGLDYTQDFSQRGRNIFIADGGFRFRGTLFDNFGYSLSFVKGALAGKRETALLTRPEFAYNFKYIENIDGTPSIDFTEGYIRFAKTFQNQSELYVQLGREKLRYGLGYGSKLVLSGAHPDLDFVKFGFNYGWFSFSSIHAATVGDFKPTREARLTKYISTHRVRLLIPKILAIGIGENVVYHGRGVDLAYLNPLQFYKFAEHSLQDRDNAAMFFDIQTHFLKNIELQASLYLDENLDFSNLDLERNKFAYQLGFFWYEFLSVKNLAFVAEYTRVRPYTYSHFDEENTYTAWNALLGHRIGANADEFYFRLTYNATEWLRPSLELQKIREGNNLLDVNGNLIRNVGGDIFLPYELTEINPIAPFLDGNRLNTWRVTATARIEFVRNALIELRYGYRKTSFLAEGGATSDNFGSIRFLLEY